MKKLIIIISAVALIACGSRQSTKKQEINHTPQQYAGIYTFGDAVGASEKPHGAVYIYPETDSTALFYLFVIKGAPSYNNGSMRGRMTICDGKAVFRKRYDFEEKDCVLRFEFQENTLTVAEDDVDCACGFGHGVYADGTFQRTTPEIPPYYTAVTGEKVYFSEWQEDEEQPDETIEMQGEIIGTFQGQIAGDATFFLHVEITGGRFAGFYKCLTDSFAVPLKGTVDREGNFTLADRKNPRSVFTGTLQNRLVQGTFRASEKANPQPFYAVNFRGEYGCDTGNSFSLVLSENGYLLDDLNVTTHQQDDGSIYLLCDTLNIRLCLKDSTWMNKDEQPAFTNHEGKLVRMFFNDFISGHSRIEFPEMFTDDDDEYSMKEIRLNDSYTVKFRQIRQSEYVVRKWEAAHLYHKPYKVITDVTEAQKMLGNSLKTLKPANEIKYEIIFKDGAKKRLDSEYGFYAYYPQLEILLFSGGHGGDCPFDLNDSKNERAGNPYYHAISPDKQFRINGAHSG
jgi:hypothetical protein